MANAVQQFGQDIGGLLADIIPPVPGFRPGSPTRSRGLQDVADVTRTSDPISVGAAHNFSMGPNRPYAPNQSIIGTIARAVGDVLGPDATFTITSGTEGNLPQYGSNRHKTGQAADVAIYDANGNRVTAYGTPGTMQSIARAAAARGAKGIGFGTDYMGGSHMHIDLVPPGPGQSNTWGNMGRQMRGELVGIMQQPVPYLSQIGAIPTPAESPRNMVANRPEIATPGTMARSLPPAPVGSVQTASLDLLPSAFLPAPVGIVERGHDLPTPATAAPITLVSRGLLATVQQQATAAPSGPVQHPGALPPAAYAGDPVIAPPGTMAEPLTPVPAGSVTRGLLADALAPSPAPAPSAQGIEEARTSLNVTDQEYAAQLRAAGLSETEIQLALSDRLREPQPAPVPPVQSLAPPVAVKQYNVAAAQPQAAPMQQPARSGMDVWQGQSTYGTATDGSSLYRNPDGSVSRYSQQYDRWDTHNPITGQWTPGGGPASGTGNGGRGFNLPSRDRVRGFAGGAAGGAAGGLLLGPLGGLLGAALGQSLATGQGFGGMFNGGATNVFPAAPGSGQAGPFPAAPRAPRGSNGGSGTSRSYDEMAAISPAAADAISRGQGGLF